MPADSSELRRLLIRKFGFEPVPGSKHDALALFHNGKKIATTRFSRGGAKVLGDTLLRIMAAEVRVDQFGFSKK